MNILLLVLTVELHAHRLRQLHCAEVALGASEFAA